MPAFSASTFAMYRDDIPVSSLASHACKPIAGRAITSGVTSAAMMSSAALITAFTCRELADLMPCSSSHIRIAATSSGYEKSRIFFP